MCYKMCFNSTFISLLLLLGLVYPREAFGILTFDKVTGAEGNPPTPYHYRGGWKPESTTEFVPFGLQDSKSNNNRPSRESFSSANLDQSASEDGAIREKRQHAHGGSGQVEIGNHPGGNARSFFDFNPGGSGGLCFEREVTGTCRYRSSPDECFRHEWTAYATFYNDGIKKITSIPEGLFVFPGGHERVRVFLKSSCCNPIVQFIAYDLFLQPSVCLVDVRQYQDLHPGEIAGIVVGVLLLILIIILIVIFCIRRQRQQQAEKQTVIFGRSLTRTKR